MDYTQPIKATLQEAPFSYLTKAENLLPDTIVIATEQISNATWVSAKIHQWGAFEHSIVEWDHTKFEELLLDDFFNSPKDNLILITDEGLTNNVLFTFTPESWISFVDWYETKYEMEFMQPSDYILFNTTEKRISIIHHEGILFLTQL